MVDLRRLRQAFGYAFSGVAHVLKTQQNFRIGLAGAILVIAAGVFFRITLSEWTLVIFATLLVLVTEMINTVFEEMVDLLKCEYDRRCKAAKDVSAGMVVLALLAAIIVGLLVFLPRAAERITSFC